MLIIAGPVYVDPDGRDAFVEAHRDLVVAARAFPGCVDMAVTGDAVDPSRALLYEVWASEQDLEAWRATAPVPSGAPEIVRDEVRKHWISASGDPF